MGSGVGWGRGLKGVAASDTEGKGSEGVRGGWHGGRTGKGVVQDKTLPKTQGNLIRRAD